MKANDFFKLVERRINICQDTLVEKGKEYASNDDRLHNFKRCAEVRGHRATPSTAALWLATKHEVSIDDMVYKIPEGYKPTQEMIDEKFKDAVNYLFLLEGTLMDELRAKYPGEYWI